MRFFISPFFILLSFSVIAFIWLFVSSFLSLMLLASYGVYLFFFRRLSPSYREDFVLKDGIFYAPVNGRVSYVRKGVGHGEDGQIYHEIGIVSSWLREGGMYLPIRSEVINLSYNKGKSLFRYIGKAYEKAREELSRLTVELRCSNGDLYYIDSIKCVVGLWPKVRVIPGDRGKAQVNFGFFGLGGTTVLYLPQNYEILVKEGLESIAGQTIMASLKEEVVKEDQ